MPRYFESWECRGVVMSGLRRSVVDDRRPMPAQFLVHAECREIQRWRRGSHSERKITGRSMRFRRRPELGGSLVNEKLWANRDLAMRERRASPLLGRSSSLAGMGVGRDAAFLRAGQDEGEGGPCTKLRLGGQGRQAPCTPTYLQRSCALYGVGTQYAYPSS